MVRWKKDTLVSHLADDHKLGPYNDASWSELRTMHSAQHGGKPHPPTEPEYRPISGWVMLPVHVTVDTVEGKPKVVQANVFYDYARPARDDLDDEHGFFEYAQLKENPNRLYYEGADDGEKPKTQAETDRWRLTMYDDLEHYLENLWEAEVE